VSTNNGLQPPDTFPLGVMTIEVFLREYWQKKPCLFRGVWPGIENSLPIDADELAGIAADETADARLISGTFEKCNWQVDYGPFDSQDYDQLGEANWTLLVQDVEKHYPPLKNWLSSFSFLPSWRLDDIMISFAATGGSVGPHTDQYDVFLFQASGSRRWQISDTYKPKLLEHEEIKVLKEFDADQSWDLEPGDLLYLPPNVAHFGVALNPCLSYSVGLRAPGRAELFADLAEWFAREDDQGGRYGDADLDNNSTEISTSEVDSSVIGRVRQLLNTTFPDKNTDINSAENPLLSDWFCQFISSYRLSGSPAPAELQLSQKQLQESLRGGACLYRNPWSRFCWRRTDNTACLYATGMKVDCETGLARLICEPGDELDLQALGVQLNVDNYSVLTSLYNNGHLLLESD
jgi:50S ribosomal protein L16 3-hydroxylase